LDIGSSMPDVFDASQRCQYLAHSAPPLSVKLAMRLCSGLPEGEVVLRVVSRQLITTFPTDVPTGP